ncbi:unnamed protein product [Schistosoma mattheei]|uniref:Uncharacterized protein n=1 Tax=Schistosoma mattheei TaxID=31246 RepID=A0A183P202_9TREM|nr:unnamed protein product [Schistosoma mattheei]
MTRMTLTNIQLLIGCFCQFEIYSTLYYSNHMDAYHKLKHNKPIDHKRIYQLHKSLVRPTRHRTVLVPSNQVYQK